MPSRALVRDHQIPSETLVGVLKASKCLIFVRSEIIAFLQSVRHALAFQADVLSAMQQPSWNVFNLTGLSTDFFRLSRAVDTWRCIICCEEMARYPWM